MIKAPSRTIQKNNLTFRKFYSQLYEKTLERNEEIDIHQMKRILTSLRTSNETHNIHYSNILGLLHLYKNDGIETPVNEYPGIHKKMGEKSVAIDLTLLDTKCLELIHEYIKECSC